MQAAETPPCASASATLPGLPQQAIADLEIVFEPLTRPELGDIQLSGSVFAVGRTEAPFASYPDDILVMLSRRHARVFRERSGVYVVDLRSRNGTTVNRNPVIDAPCQLRDGDKICFGGALCYRVRLAASADSPQPDSLVLTLMPESAESGAEQIVITRFPFLVGKEDGAFQRVHGHALRTDYLSRRHAHIFRKGDEAWVEDLASTNGTFVDGVRLQEQAVPLRDGALISFGGAQLTYRICVTPPVRTDLDEAPPGVLLGGAVLSATPLANAGKTTFVAVPDSFLDIFCADPVAAPSEGVAVGPALEATEPSLTMGQRSRRRALAFLAELATVLAGDDRQRMRQSLLMGAATLAAIGVTAIGLCVWVGADLDVKDLIARGEYSLAATRANEALAAHPDDNELRVVATEAVLKANVPAWLRRLDAGDVNGAQAVLSAMASTSQRNPDLRPLIDELDWLGKLERLVRERGGPDAPIRIYADEDRIASLVERWNNASGEHQRSLARVASYVPEFSEPYAEALKHLRRLQSEATVHLAAIERLKAAMANELARDRPEALEALLADNATRYPGLGGLDVLRKDLSSYLALRDALARRGRVFPLLGQAQFVTPIFQSAFRALASSGQLPPDSLVQAYQASTRAWQEGRTDESLASLQRLAQDPWADVIWAELARRRDVASRFESLGKARDTSGYVEQFVAFRASIDPVEDSHFARATQAELALQKDQVVMQANEQMNRARLRWQQYRKAGEIDAAQHIETRISATFRTRANLLVEADRLAQQGMRLHALAGGAGAAAWNAIHDEICAEARRQRAALLELRNVLEPGLFEAKFALLGGTEP